MAGPHEESEAERFLIDAEREKLRSHALLGLVDAADGVLDDEGVEKGLAVVCARLLRAMDCTTAVLSLVDPSSDELVSVAGFDLSGVRTAVQGSRSLSADPNLARVVERHEASFAMPGESGGGERPGAPITQAVGGWLALPLVLHGRCVGVLELLAGFKERRYSAAEIALAQAICMTVARGLSQSTSLVLPADAGAVGPAVEAGGPDGADGGRREVERTLNELARRLAVGLEVEQCDVLIREAGSGAAKVIARYCDGDGSGGAEGLAYGLGDIGSRALAAAQRRVAAAYDDDDALAADERAEMAARRLRAVLYVPVVEDGEVVGFLSAVERRHARRFTRADEDFAERLAAEVAVAVASAWVVDRLHVQNQELRLLLETSRAITTSIDLRETLATIAQRLVETLGVAWSNVYDLHPESAELEVIAYYQVPGVPVDPDWLGRRFDERVWPEGLAAVRDREPKTRYYDYSRLSFDDFAFMEPWGEKANLTVPLLHGDEVLGVVDLAESRYPRRFTAGELRLAQAVADQAAVAIHNARLYDVTRRRTSELSTFLGVAESLSSVTEPGAVLAAIAHRLREALHSFSAEVYEYDPQRRVIMVRAYDADEALDVGDWSGAYDLNEFTLMGECIDGRVPVVVRRDDPRLPDNLRAELEHWGTASELWVPLVYGDEVLGLMLAEEVDSGRRYTSDQMRLAAGIASHAAVALENARAYERLEREREALTRLNERLSAFTQLTGQMRGLLTEDELLDLLGRVMWEALGFNQWVTYLYDSEERVYNVAKAFGGTPEIDEHYASTPIPALVLDGLIGAARPVSQSFFVDHDTHTWTDEENFYLPGEDLVDDREPGEWDRFDTLFVPMIGQKGQLIGYIEAYDPRDRQRPTEDLVRMIEVFAGKAASNIELQRAYGELEQQSRTDGLTGLYNHRFLQERLVAEVARARRFGKPLALLMIDVDDFKDYNDTYGHPQGDRLLKALADLLLAETRANVDFVARYGGEEFVVLLPETDLGEAPPGGRPPDAVDGRPPAEEVAERIRLATEQMPAVGAASEASVTVSVGVASYPEHAGTGDQLVANADKALYLAKRLGKNRTCVYGR